MTANINDLAEVVGKWSPSQQKEALMLLTKSVLPREPDGHLVFESRVSEPASSTFLLAELQPLNITILPDSEMTSPQKELVRLSKDPRNRMPLDGNYLE